MAWTTIEHLTNHQRRRAMRLSYWNGGFWAIGNGMVSSTLITFLALELGAAGLAVGLILAAPRLIGVLRIFTPNLLAWSGHRQKLCAAMYAASIFVLLTLPVLAAPNLLLTRPWALAALVATWSLYHLLEYCGTVALTSWLGDICLRRVQGQFFGRRERWLTLGRIVGMTAAGLFTYWWANHHARDARWQGYALAAEAGAVVMLVSLWPLIRMPNVPLRTGQKRNQRQASLAPSSLNGTEPKHRPQKNDRRLTDPAFLRLLIFGCAFSLVNGITQSAQGVFPYKVLDLHLFALLALEAVMRLGQGAISPTLGKLIDRFGNRPVMIVSQMIVALGLVFYLPASPEDPWWIVGGWVCWVAYAGINIALSSLTIKLAGQGEASLYLAAWFGITGVIYGISTIVGGVCFDALVHWNITLQLTENWQVTIDRYQLLFACGILGRMLVAVSLFALIEPGASTVRELLGGKRVLKANEPDANDDSPVASS